MNLLRFPNTNSYQVSKSLYLESYGIYDGFYYVELVGHVFRCKILDVVDGVLITPMKKKKVVLDEVDLTQQELLKKRFEERQKLVRLANYLLEFGFYCKVQNKFYQPGEFKVDIDNNKITNQQGLLLSNLTEVNGLEQRQLIENFKVKVFMLQAEDVLTALDNYMKNPSDSSQIAQISSFAYKTCFFASKHLHPLYESDSSIAPIYSLIYNLWSLYNNHNTAPAETIELLNVFVESSSGVFENVKLVKIVKRIMFLQDYYAFIAKYNNFYKRRNKESLIESYELLVEYVSLQTENPILYKFLARSQFMDKMQKYYCSYLDQTRIYEMIVSRQKVALNNEFNLIKAIYGRVKGRSDVNLNLDKLIVKFNLIQQEFLS